MDIEQISALFGNKKNLIFIGEAGCGKTEASMNFAIAMSLGGRLVHFFDMDQTKPLFRSRDSVAAMKAAGVIVRFQEQFLDLPTLVPAVNEMLEDTGVQVVMDVGGSVQGARMIGQFNARLNRENSEAIFIINPYRPWSNNPHEIAEATARVTSACRIGVVRIACNPTLGLDTSADEAVLGSNRLTELIGKKPDFTLAREEIAANVALRLTEPVFALHIYIRYPWQV
jgi:hypothetical protein